MPISNRTSNISLSGDGGKCAATFIVEPIKASHHERHGAMKRSFLMKRFRAIEAEYSAIRENWFNLTQVERDEIGADGFGLTEAIRVLKLSAKDLVADAAERHTIEESVKVYLTLGKDGWKVDSSPMAGSTLSGLDDGPSNAECGHEKGLDGECTALRHAAALLDLPTSAELADMLQDTRYDNMPTIG